MELAPYYLQDVTRKLFVCMHAGAQEFFFFYWIKSSKGHSFAYLKNKDLNYATSLEALEVRERSKKKFSQNHRDMWKDNYSTATTTVPTW